MDACGCACDHDGEDAEDKDVLWETARGKKKTFTAADTNYILRHADKKRNVAAHDNGLGIVEDHVDLSVAILGLGSVSQNHSPQYQAALWQKATSILNSSCYDGREVRIITKIFDPAMTTVDKLVSQKLGNWTFSQDLDLLARVWGAEGAGGSGAGGRDDVRGPPCSFPPGNTPRANNQLLVFYMPLCTKDVYKSAVSILRREQHGGILVGSDVVQWGDLVVDESGPTSDIESSLQIECLRYSKKAEKQAAERGEQQLGVHFAYDLRVQRFRGRPSGRDPPRGPFREDEQEPHEELQPTEVFKWLARNGLVHQRGLGLDDWELVPQEPAGRRDDLRTKYCFLPYPTPLGAMWSNSDLGRRSKTNTHDQQEDETARPHRADEPRDLRALLPPVGTPVWLDRKSLQQDGRSEVTEVQFGLPSTQKLLDRYCRCAPADNSEFVVGQARLANSLSTSICAMLVEPGYENVLEIGCSTGLTTEQMLHQKPHSLLAVDIAGEMVDRTQMKMNDFIAKNKWVDNDIRGSIDSRLRGVGSLSVGKKRSCHSVGKKRSCQVRQDSVVRSTAIKMGAQSGQKNRLHRGPPAGITSADQENEHRIKSSSCPSRCAGRCAATVFSSSYLLGLVSVLVPVLFVQYQHVLTPKLKKFVNGKMCDWGLRKHCNNPKDWLRITVDSPDKKDSEGPGLSASSPWGCDCNNPKDWLRITVDSPDKKIATLAKFLKNDCKATGLENIYIGYFPKGPDQTYTGTMLEKMHCMGFARSLAKDTHFVCVPKKCWLGEPNLPDRFRQCDTIQYVMAHWVADELRKGEESFWKPYLDSIPPRSEYEMYHPAFWKSSGERFRKECVERNNGDATQCPEVWDAAGDGSHLWNLWFGWVSDCYKKYLIEYTAGRWEVPADEPGRSRIIDRPLTEEEVHFGYVLTMTRDFEGVGNLPLIEEYNSHQYWFDENKQSFCLLNEKAVRRGDEVNVNYAQNTKNPFMMFAQYGFALDKKYHAPYGFSSARCTGLGDSDMVHEKQNPVAENWSHFSKRFCSDAEMEKLRLEEEGITDHEDEL
eukprot:g2280.t1